MRTFSITDVGMVRQVNQDYVYATDQPLGILQNLFVVADGMGGHQAGDYASKYTVVAATIMNQMMYFANVGDSRLYLINQGIQQLTKDHSLVEEMVRLGGIKPEEAKHHPDKNIITRAIGAKADEDEELFHFVLGGRDIVEAGQALVDAAKENGGTDNIGVVLVEPFADEVSVL